MKSFGILTFSAICASFALANPSRRPNGVLNGASFVTGQAVAAGSLVSIFGSELAAGLTQNDTIPLSTSLANVSVAFNNIPAGLISSHRDRSLKSPGTFSRKEPPQATSPWW